MDIEKITKIFDKRVKIDKEITDFEVTKLNENHDGYKRAVEDMLRILNTSSFSKRSDTV